ncbi:hypothetical protein BHE74_00043372 [Ensete ventricosum]|nr:hypothetical protein BHE74_00043372 [Ensete ventricosum]RZS15930.1 hypothetical protein BHM03_00047838 [Ensete ventricosum]
MVSRKHVTFIYFPQSHARSQVLINLSCTVSKIKNTCQSQSISAWEVVRAWFRKKMQRS